MTHRDGNRLVIAKEKPQQCDLCGKVDELRPYGPNGECICFECCMKNEPAARRQFRKRLASPTEQEGGDANDAP